MSDNKNLSSLSQQEALSNYFDDLLATANGPTPAGKGNLSLKLVHSASSSADKPEEASTAIEVSKPRLKTEKSKVEVFGAMPEDKVELVEEILEDEELSEKSAAISTEVEALVAQKMVEHDDGRPSWAAESFEALVFEINKMKIAVPTFLLNGQQAFPSKLKQLPNRPEWVLGLDIASDGFTAVIDSALLLLNQARNIDAKSAYKQVILLANSRWGLAVDCVFNDKVIVNSNEVSWRVNARSRLWLAGIESNQQLAIIDTNNIFTKSDE